MHCLWHTNPTSTQIPDPVTHVSIREPDVCICDAWNRCRYICSVDWLATRVMPRSHCWWRTVEKCEDRSERCLLGRNLFANSKQQVNKLETVETLTRWNTAMHASWNLLQSQYVRILFVVWRCRNTRVKCWIIFQLFQHYYQWWEVC